ncbi:unnamed protein product [Cyclocybe aegerita]|uniref:Uncharacterized protein n=1 Tax=Cyclocybe aegerita TaxID=1973307 RepID=A0A8S0W8N3_CYCAE|nr:unnamed protein product [Cyclocybe aegerita]
MTLRASNCAVVQHKLKGAPHALLLCFPLVLAGSRLYSVKSGNLTPRHSSVYPDKGVINFELLHKGTDRPYNSKHPQWYFTHNCTAHSTPLSSLPPRQESGTPRCCYMPLATALTQKSLKLVFSSFVKMTCSPPLRPSSSQNTPRQPARPSTHNPVPYSILFGTSLASSVEHQVEIPSMAETAQRLGLASNTAPRDVEPSSVLSSPHTFNSPIALPRDMTDDDSPITRRPARNSRRRATKPAAVSPTNDESDMDLTTATRNSLQTFRSENSLREKNATSSPDASGSGRRADIDIEINDTIRRAQEALAMVDQALVLTVENPLPPHLPVSPHLADTIFPSNPVQVLPSSISASVDILMDEGSAQPPTPARKPVRPKTSQLRPILSTSQNHLSHFRERPSMPDDMDITVTTPQKPQSVGLSKTIHRHMNGLITINKQKQKQKEESSGSDSDDVAALVACFSKTKIHNVNASTPRPSEPTSLRNGRATGRGDAPALKGGDAPSSSVRHVLNASEGTDDINEMDVDPSSMNPVHKPSAANQRTVARAPAKPAPRPGGVQRTSEIADKTSEMDTDSSTPLSPGERKISPLPLRARNQRALPPTSAAIGTVDQAPDRERSVSPIMTIIPPVPVPRIIITDDAAPLVASPESSPPPSPGPSRRERKVRPLPQRFWQSTQGTITKPTFNFTLSVPRASKEAPKTATAAPAVPASSEPSRLPSGGFTFQLPGSGDAPALRGGDAPATRDVGKTLLGGTDENGTTDAVSREAGEIAVDRKVKPLPPKMRRPAGTPNIPLLTYVPTHGQTIFVSPQLNTWQGDLEDDMTRGMKRQDQEDAAAKATTLGRCFETNNQTSMTNGTGSSHPVYNTDSARFLLLYGEMMAGASAADLAASGALLALGGDPPESSPSSQTSADQTNDESEFSKRTDIEMDFSNMTDEEINATLSSWGFNPASDQSFTLEEMNTTCEATFELNMLASAPIAPDYNMTIAQGQMFATGLTDQDINANNYHPGNCPTQITIQQNYESQLNYALGYNNIGVASEGQVVHQSVCPPEGRQDNSLAASSSTAIPTREVDVHDHEQVDWSDSEIVPATSRLLIPKAPDNLGIGSQERYNETPQEAQPFQYEEVEATNGDEDMEEVDIDAALAERETGQQVPVQGFSASAADSPFEEPLIAPECSETSSAMITPAVQHQAQQGSSVPSVDLVAESSPRPNEEVGVACRSTSVGPATSPFVVHDASHVPLPELPLIKDDKKLADDASVDPAPSFCDSDQKRERISIEAISAAPEVAGISESLSPTTNIESSNTTQPVVPFEPNQSSPKSQEYVACDVVLTRVAEGHPVDAVVQPPTPESPLQHLEKGKQRDTSDAQVVVPDPTTNLPTGSTIEESPLSSTSQSNEPAASSGLDSQQEVVVQPPTSIEGQHPNPTEAPTKAARPEDAPIATFSTIEQESNVDVFSVPAGGNNVTLGELDELESQPCSPPVPIPVVNQRSPAVPRPASTASANGLCDKQAGASVPSQDTLLNNAPVQVQPPPSVIPRDQDVAMDLDDANKEGEKVREGSCEDSEMIEELPVGVAMDLDDAQAYALYVPYLMLLRAPPAQRTPYEDADANDVDMPDDLPDPTVICSAALHHWSSAATDCDFEMTDGCPQPFQPQQVAPAPSVSLPNAAPVIASTPFEPTNAVPLVNTLPPVDLQPSIDVLSPVSGPPFDNRFVDVDSDMDYVGPPQQPVTLWFDLYREAFGCVPAAVHYQPQVPPSSEQPPSAPASITNVDQCEVSEQVELPSKPEDQEMPQTTQPPPPTTCTDGNGLRVPTPAAPTLPSTPAPTAAPAPISIPTLPPTPEPAPTPAFASTPAQEEPLVTAIPEPSTPAPSSESMSTLRTPASHPYRNSRRASTLRITSPRSSYYPMDWQPRPFVQRTPEQIRLATSAFPLPQTPAPEVEPPHPPAQKPARKRRSSKSKKSRKEEECPPTMPSMVEHCRGENVVSLGVEEGIRQMTSSSSSLRVFIERVATDVKKAAVDAVNYTALGAVDSLKQDGLTLALTIAKEKFMA